MKFYVLKSFLLAAGLLTASYSLQAQFDDVYYDADLLDPEIRYTYDDPQPLNPEGEVIYYDDDSYEYYDDYDYYYSSRIKRFYHTYAGFGFYDPIYVGYNYYDPYAWDYYAYPGSSIYFSFGIGFSFGFGSWYAPAPYYYPYNGWYYPSYTYWNGCGGYYPYGSYYNPYCPPPGYYGGSCGGGGYYPPYGDHHGGHDDYYYGPRTAGNTGSSPRGAQTIPGIVRTDVKSPGADVTDSNEKPNSLPQPGIPGKVNPSGNPVTGDPVPTPGSPSGVKQDVTDGSVRQIPIDRELPRDNTPSGPKRPVFRPDADKYQPYPTPSRPTTPSSGPQATDTDKPRPSTSGDRPAPSPGSGYKPYPQTERQDPVRPSGDYRPTTPSPSGGKTDDRPRYTPPPRPDSRGDDKPSYTPPQRSNDENRSTDRPSHSTPQKSEGQRSYDAPRQHSSPSGGNSSPSGGSNRSSGGNSGGGSSHSSSPRGRG